MAQVLAFPGAQRQVPPPEPAEADVRPESHTADEPEKPAEQPQAPKPPVYVRVRADVFEACMNALGFYAGQGWDTGNKARKVLNDTFAPEQA